MGKRKENYYKHKKNKGRFKLKEKEDVTVQENFKDDACTVMPRCKPFGKVSRKKLLHNLRNAAKRRRIHECLDTLTECPGNSAVDNIEISSEIDHQQTEPSHILSRRKENLSSIDLLNVQETPIASGAAVDGTAGPGAGASGDEVEGESSMTAVEPWLLELIDNTPRANKRRKLNEDKDKSPEDSTSSEKTGTASEKPQSTGADGNTGPQKKGRPKLEPEPPPEPGAEPGEGRAPPAAEPVVVTGKRSCTLRRCAFASCPNHDAAADARGDVTFFPFPRNPVASARWARVVGRAQGQEFRAKLTSVVCAAHFASWQILPDGRGGATLYKSAVPSEHHVPPEETQNIEEVLLSNDVNLNEQPPEDVDALAIKVETDNPDYELRQAVDSIVNIPPPENGIRIQCVGLDSGDNATLHYLSVDKDYTVNHTRVNISKNNIATLNYVDTDNKVNHTLKCINLNEESVSTYEELIKPIAANTHTEKAPFKQLEISPDTQNSQGTGYNFKVKGCDADKSTRNDEPLVMNVAPPEVPMSSSTDTLCDLTTVKSEVLDESVEMEDIVVETDDSPDVLPCDVDIKQELNDSDELYVVQLEYDDC